MPVSPAPIRGCKVTLVPPCKSKPNLKDVAPVITATPVKATIDSKTIEIVRRARDWVCADLFADMVGNSRGQRIFGEISAVQALYAPRFSLNNLSTVNLIWIDVEKVWIIDV